MNLKLLASVNINIDVNQKELANTLDAVIEAAVNHVGVELNTASAALLKHIAGINATVAKKYH